MKTWVFNWLGGGYNTVRAETRDQAMVLARAIGAATPTFHGLQVNERTLREVTDAEMEAIDASYRGMFD